MKPKIEAIPGWGWLVLIPCLFVSARLLSFIAGELLFTPLWMDSAFWGIGVALCLGFSLWLGQVRSPNLALILAVSFFTYIVLQSQLDMMDSNKERFYNHIHQNEHPYPSQWKKLSKYELYDAFIKDSVEPIGWFWLDHLRANAEIGVFTTSYQGQKRYGAGGDAHEKVYIQGIWMWLGWLVFHLCLAIGCFLGLYGSNIRQDEFRLLSAPDKILKDAVVILSAKGFSAKEINRFFTRPNNGTRKIHMSDDDVLMLLPNDNPSANENIIELMKLAKSWFDDYRANRILPDKHTARLKEMRRSFYGTKEMGNPLETYHLFILAADQLNSQHSKQGFYDGLVVVTHISRLFGFYSPIPAFRTIDLLNIEFQTVSCGVQWQLMFGKGQHFYDRDSQWNKLDFDSPENIPKDAYLTILYQFCHTPDRRVYDHWLGTDPQELLEVLSPMMRDAILTYLSQCPQQFPQHNQACLEKLAAYAATWDREDAEELMLRCLQAGWFGALIKLPDTEYWQRFLEPYRVTPFGELTNHVKWLKR